jgi:hypothetical protein
MMLIVYVFAFIIAIIIASSLTTKVFYKDEWWGERFFNTSLRRANLPVFGALFGFAGGLLYICGASEEVVRWCSLLAYGFGVGAFLPGIIDPLPEENQ